MNKKLAGIFAICALLLTGCQGAKESSKEITPPDTGWGKTVDEVLADWNLDRDQVEIFSETESAAAIAVDTEATVFGEKTSRVMFQFINLDQTGATGKPVLCEVDITYPDDADMDTVKKEMEKSRPGTLPQYLFLFRDHTLIGYLFLIAEKEGFCRAFPWWAVHNADELPRNTALSFLAHGIQLSLDCGCPTLANRLQAQLEDQKKGIGRRPEEACR